MLNGSCVSTGCPSTYTSSAVVYLLLLPTLLAPPVMSVPSIKVIQYVYNGTRITSSFPSIRIHSDSNLISPAFHVIVSSCVLHRMSPFGVTHFSPLPSYRLAPMSKILTAIPLTGIIQAQASELLKAPSAAYGVQHLKACSAR